MGKNTVHKKASACRKSPISRVIRAPGYIVRISAFTLLFCILNAGFSQAIETTKATGLVYQKGQGPHSSLRSPQSPSLSRNGDRQQTPSPCLSLLTSAKNVSPKHSFDAGSRHHAGKAAVPVALGLFLGVRLALIPSPAPLKDQKLSQRLRIGPEIRGVSSHGNSYALAVAAYRKCQKEEFLKTGQ
jgi:hypothetical protein